MVRAKSPLEARSALRPAGGCALPRAHVARFALVAVTTGCASDPPWPAREEPVAYPPGALVALALDARSDALLAIRLDDAPGVIARAPLPLDPVGRDGPSDLLVDRARRTVFVALAPPLPPHPPGPHATHMLSLADGALLSVSLDTLRVRARARTEPSSSSISLDPEGGALWVASPEYLRALDVRLPPADRGGAVTAFDPVTLRSIATVRPCLVPVSVTAGPGGLAWVACFGEDALTSVRLRDGRVERGPRMPVGEQPGSFPAVRFAVRGLARDPSSGWLWTSARDARDVRAFSPVDGTLVARVPVDGVPGPPRVDADGVWLTTRLPSTLVHIVGTAVASRLTLDDSMCLYPGAVLRSDDGRLHVLCEGDARGDGALLTLSDGPVPTVARRVPIEANVTALAFVRP